MAQVNPEILAQIARAARSRYVERIAGTSPGPWWTAVVVTASSAREAQHYEDEIRHRREEGKVPSGVLYMVVPDIAGQRLGSGGATIHALGKLVQRMAGAAGEEWWRGQRVLMIHCGGDAHRLPQYSLSGKLFSALPVKTPWGEVSTIFDEFLALSTSWAAGFGNGLLVASGDVLLTFAAEDVNWNRPGVCGVAIRQPAEVGARHGVYVTDEEGRVYAFLQKPSAAQVRAAGGLLPDGQVAVDTGLLRFEPRLAAALARLGPEWAPGASLPPVIDLYEHMTFVLTGQWTPEGAATVYHRVAEVLKDAPFGCSVVDGQFTHLGTTTHFRRIFTEDGNYSPLVEAHQRLDTAVPAGMISSGVIIDSVFSAGGEIGPDAVAIECNLDAPVRAERGAILHGLSGVSPVDIPADTVAHQVPVVAAGGKRGFVVRVYGVEDDPKMAVWFGRPIEDVLQDLGADPEMAWAGVPRDERTLWNARLFPMGTLDEAWQCARWIMRRERCFSAERWGAMERLSFATSAQQVDAQALADAQTSRRQASWQATALSLAVSGTDMRPLLAHAPGIAPVAAAGRALAERAQSLAKKSPTEAASQFYQAGQFFTQAGLKEQAESAQEAAFEAVRQAVEAGAYENAFAGAAPEWQHETVTVSAPPRIDFGGGWSDTPPFCLDWGGTVLNMAVELNGRYPIATTLRRIEEPVVRCWSEGNAGCAEFRSAEEILAPAAPGSAFAIPRVALALAGVASPGVPLSTALARCGGGLEIRMEVDLPMGSGLGTSSILAATLLRALGEMRGCRTGEQELSDSVMLLEQLMTTGGGWQDQIGGIFPGTKLAVSGPGLRQRVRVQPVAWSEARQNEFRERFLLYYTGIRRMAKGLLRQVVGSYLARETATVQVLHSIKTLALEMAYAMREGEWAYLGELLERHWALNQRLDPHTTNAPINALRREIQPYLAGAKLAGAGGGGFLMLLAKSPGHARALRAKLGEFAAVGHGALYEFRIANDGLRTECEPAQSGAARG